MIRVVAAVQPDEVDGVRTLFREYADRTHFLQCFQQFDKELVELPGEYGPPTGTLLLARDDEELVGCVALRKIDDGVCEMKRLYVRSAYRGRGIGRQLTERVLADARALGYQRMRLDTLQTMIEARTMYTQLGFQPIEPYRQYPICGVLFFEREV